MALPKLNDTPKYSMTIPSNGQEVRFRPFLVKEEKVMMLAMETEDQQLILNSITDTLSACVVEDIDTDTLTTFDVEYMFVTLRSKSVGETINMKMKCAKCEVENEYNLKVDDLKVDMTERDMVIKLDEDITIEMGYPTYKIVGQNLVEDIKESELVFNVLANCIKQVRTEEEVFSLKDEKSDDVQEFIESMNSAQFAKVQEWVEAMPKLSHTIEFDCTGCNSKEIHLVEGMQSFFT